MMNTDNDDVQPVTDLGFVLASSNQCIQTRLSNSGAGVNAASMVDMTFVASDSLSELIWSPHNGLSLKCADCSFVEKKPSLLWDVRQSNMVPSPTQSITSRETTGDRPIEKGNLITSHVGFHVGKEVGEGAILVRSPGSMAGIKPVFGSSHQYHAGASDTVVEMNTVGGASAVHTNQKLENTSKTDGKDLCSPNNIQVASIDEIRQNNEGMTSSVAPPAGLENQKTIDFLGLGTNELLSPDMAQSEPLSMEQKEGMRVNPSGRGGEVAGGSQTLGLEVDFASEVHSIKQCKGLDSPMPNLTSPGGKKDLLLVKEEESKNQIMIDGSSSMPPLEKLESTAENDLQLQIGKDACGKIEERLPRDDSVPSEASSTDSRIRQYRRKGKEKALSDGDVNERMSKDEDGSHESVESCNSAGLFSAGKKRWSFEQQRVVGSQRVKNQIQASPASTSFVGQDSSFMNWISNMVKGLNKTNQDKAPSLALTLAHPNRGHESHDHKSTTYSRNQDPKNRNTGFEAIFQSLYCSNPKEQEPKISNGNSLIGGSKKLVLANNMSGATITPIACHGENDSLPVKPMYASAQIAAASEMCKARTCSSQNRTSYSLASIDVKDERNSTGSILGKRKTESAENNYSEPPEAKVINNVGYRCDPLGSSWITRFSPKTSASMLNFEPCNLNTSGALEGSTDCTHSRIDFPVDEKSSETKEYLTEGLVNVVGKELRSYAPNAEASFGFKRSHGHNDQKSIYKLNSVLPSPRFKNSEAMASIFARRLDALKHLVPSDVKDNATQTMTTCFYCGRNGHDLGDCSETTENERKNLVRYICSNDGAEESLCLCIRCFQLDHWAISCPMASTTRQHRSEHSAALGKMHLMMGNERHPRMLKTKESHSQVADTHTNSDGKKSRVDIDKHMASSSGGNVLKEKQITPLCNLVDAKFSDVPKGMFDAIRKLRLTRADILKWTSSHTSLFQLNGFFLRLRLGKWEEGLGGTGYYVACITGEQREKLPQGSKKPISVNFGGMRCLVESQCISNQDFLEDELLAWWCATKSSGGKIPSEDHLKLKFQERKRLGF